MRRMRRFSPLLALAVSAAVIGCGADQPEPLAPETDALTRSALADAHARATFRAHLTGGQEVPAVDTRAQGQAIFRLSEDGMALEYRLNVANIEDVVMSHIHLAPAGANGAVTAWLYPSAPPPQLIPGRFSGVLAEGTITADDLVGPLAGESLEALVAMLESGGAYVNVHTTAYPAGEIRGQIR